MKKNNKGLTLVEIMLAISIASIIFFSVYKTTNVGIQLFRRVNDNVSVEALRLTDHLKRDLQSSFLFDDKESLVKFIGNASSLKFVSTAALRDSFDGPDEFDLTQRNYFLTAGPREGVLAFKRRSKAFNQKVNISPAPKEPGKDEQILSTAIQSLKFSYFDGESWVNNFAFSFSASISISFSATEFLLLLTYD
jgi:prepilin-type N-terminal cleavage/methylation domain-containing protein